MCPFACAAHISEVVKSATYNINARIVYDRKDLVSDVKRAVDEFQTKSEILIKTRSAPQRKDSLERVRKLDMRIFLNVFFQNLREM